MTTPTLPPLPEPIKQAVEALQTAESEMRDWHIDHPARVQIADAIAVLVIAQAPIQTVPQWLPIESAPKGRKILAGYLSRLWNWRTVTACYYPSKTLEIEDDGYAPEGWYEESESQSIIPTEETPTHWMPLPQPPGAALKPQEPAIAQPDVLDKQRLAYVLSLAKAHWSTHQGDVVSSSGYSIFISSPQVFGKMGDTRPDNSRLIPAIDTALQSAIAQPAHIKLHFPTMLRKMWTGREVQQWLDEQLAQPATPEAVKCPIGLDVKGSSKFCSAGYCDTCVQRRATPERTMREAFEAWASNRHFENFKRNTGGFYVDEVLQHAWASWQAAVAGTNYAAYVSRAN